MVLKFEGFDLALPLSKLVRHTRSATFITLGLPRAPGSRSSEFAPFVKITTTGRLVLSYPVGQKAFRKVNENGGANVGVGVFQLTVTPNSGVTSDRANNVAWAANYAANMLATNMGFLQDAHTNFNQTQLLQATAATYDMGLGKHPRGSNISGNPNTIDVGTKPNNNYGSLVLGLMNCF
jgi:hypothetical protein